MIKFKTIKMYITWYILKGLHMVGITKFIIWRKSNGEQSYVTLIENSLFAMEKEIMNKKLFLLNNRVTIMQYVL